MSNTASFSGCSFYKVLYTGYLITLSVYSNTSLPLSNLDQKDCNSNWNMSHRMYETALKESQVNTFSNCGSLGDFSFPFCLLFVYFHFLKY